jgi:hypothetical protein
MSMFTAVKEMEECHRKEVHAIASVFRIPPE